MDPQICKNCQKNFQIEEADLEFLKKFEVPSPTFCPDCRNQRRMAFRNDRNFYRRECDLCKKTIISIYSPEKPFPVYCKDCYLSDRFDPLQYGVDFDPTRSFFEQFGEMRSRVPRMASYQTQSENSDYTVHSAKNRNCYMGNSFRECENVYYADFAQYSKDSADLFMCSYMEKCYDCSDSDQCYQSLHLENCLGTNFSCLCFDCHGSSNLIACVGLRRKEFMVLNQAVSKEIFEETLRRFNTDPAFRKELTQKYHELRLQIPVKNFWESNSEHCTGNYIVNSKNARHSYNVRKVEDSRYNFDTMEMKDTMDLTRAVSGEFLYEIHAMIDLFFSKFCNLCYQSSELEYCDNCQASKKSFGCMSLKNHSYCVLNKSYSPEDYARLVEQIKNQMKASGEYGEFFPATLSPFAYNETMAQDYYPLSQEAALAKGIQWKADDPHAYLAQTYVIPNNITAVPDSVVNEVLACETCKKNYKIIPQELKLYRELGVPIPKKCFSCRLKERKALQNQRQLWNRECVQCKAGIVTTYGPEKREIVYCEKCYLAAVY